METNENTGLMLSQTKGPLTTLMNNLSGKHADYWLTALNKMLRKEEIPEPPAEVLEQMEKFNFQTVVREKLEEIESYLRTIPAVKRVYICEEDDQDLINIEVYTTGTNFIRRYKEFDESYFYLKLNGKVVLSGVDNDADFIFDEWLEKYFPNNENMVLKDFCEALVALGEMYQNAVLQISVK